MPNDLVDRGVRNRDEWRAKGSGRLREFGLNGIRQMGMEGRCGKRDVDVERMGDGEAVMLMRERSDYVEVIGGDGGGQEGVEERRGGGWEVSDELDGDWNRDLERLEGGNGRRGVENREGFLDRRREGEESVVGGLRVSSEFSRKEGVEAQDRS